MIVNFSDTSFSDDIRTFYVNGDGFSNFPLVRVGKKSFVVSSVIEAGISLDSTSLLIGNYCSIAHNVSFLINLDHDYLLPSTYPVFKMCLDWKLNKVDRKKGQIIIGNDVWIGRAATILDGVTIGNGAVVSANAVVTKDVPPYAIVAGNPAKVKKYRFSENVVSKLNTIKWWYWEYEKILKNREFFTTYSMDNIDVLYEESVRHKYVEQNDTEYEFSNIKDKYLFILDFNNPYSIWKKIIGEFLDKFSSKDDVALILYVDGLSDNYEEISYIIEATNSKEDQPNVFLESENEFTNEIQLLREVNYFITNRDITSIKLMDYAYDFGVKPIFGMKNPVF